MDQREIIQRFYHSRAWRECRTAFASSRGGLCERCLAKGLYSPGEAVHHKVRLTADNINDPMITLNWDNLELLCHECHTEEHQRIRPRYVVSRDGRVRAR